MCESLVNGLKGEGIGNGKFFVKPKKSQKSTSTSYEKNVCQ